MPWIAAAAVAAPIIGGIIGQVASAGDKKKAEAAMKEAISIIDSVGAPPDLSREIIREKFQQAGVLTPEVEQAIDVGISKVSQIQEDAGLRQAQMGALQTLSQVGVTGLRPEDRAALNQVRAEVQRDAEAKRQQIIQNMQARGQAGGGAELAASLLSSQGATETAAEQSDRLAAQASQNALAAIQQAGNLGGSIRSQDFNVAQAKAQAADAFRQFDVQNQIAQQQRNIASKNQAQQFNLTNLQDITNKNVDQINQERLRQAQAKQDYFQDQLNLAQARSNARNAQQNFYTNRAQSTAQAFSSMGSGAGQGLGAMAGAMSDKNLKTDISDSSERLHKALNELRPYQYKYKDEKFGDGDQVGIMAQDLEKLAPQAVEDTEDGKMVDFSKLGGPIMAILAHLNERLNELEGKEEK